MSRLLRTVGDATSALAAISLLATVPQHDLAILGSLVYTGTPIARASSISGAQSRGRHAAETSYRRARDLQIPLGQFLTALDRLNLAIDLWQREFDIARQWIERAITIAAMRLTTRCCVAASILRYQGGGARAKAGQGAREPP